jgi:hypothetical protein
MKNKITIITAIVVFGLLFPNAGLGGDGGDGMEFDPESGTIGIEDSCNADCSGQANDGNLNGVPGEKDSLPGTSGTDPSKGSDGSPNTPGIGGEGVTNESDFSVDGQSWCYPSGKGPTAEQIASEGGWGQYGGTDILTCDWTCGDDTAQFTYLGDGNWQGVVDDGSDGQWNFEGVDNGYIGSVSLGTIDFSTDALPVCGEWDTSGYARPRTAFEICWRKLQLGTGSENSTPGNPGEEGTGESNPGTGPSVGGGGLSITCGASYEVEVTASIPCPAIIREPYPRAIVSEPVIFTLGAGGHLTRSGSRESCEPGIRDYTIYLGWVQVPITPQWWFGDRPWSPYPNIAFGWTVPHIYETASYGLRPLGPSLRGHLELPAYEVYVQTYWMARVRDQWEEWHTFDFDCEATDFDCLAQEDACESNTALDDPQCGEWRTKSSGWINIDLRDLGYSSPYGIRTNAEDATQPHPSIPSVPDHERYCGIPVPVLESQALLHE